MANTTKKHIVRIPVVRLDVNYATVERIRLIEDNTFDYRSAPVTTEQIRFVEDNVWEH